MQSYHYHPKHIPDAVKYAGCRPKYRAHLGPYAGEVRQVWGTQAETVEFKPDPDQGIPVRCVQVSRHHPELVLAGYIDPSEALPTNAELVQQCSQTVQPVVDGTPTVPVTPVEPASRTQQLGQMIAQGLDIASRTGNQEQADRLMKAAWIVLNGDVVPQEDGSYLVRSQTDREQAHIVKGRSCSCPDWTKHMAQGLPTFACKHRAATALYIRLNA